MENKESSWNGILNVFNLEIFQSKEKRFIVGSIYRPMEDFQYLNISLSDIFLDINVLLKDAIILGDFDINYLNKFGCKELKDVLSLCGYKRLMKQPARVKNEWHTLTDIILSNDESQISFSDVITLSLSNRDAKLVLEK